VQGWIIPIKESTATASLWQWQLQNVLLLQFLLLQLLLAQPT